MEVSNRIVIIAKGRMEQIRMIKEECAALGLQDGHKVSFQIRQYRLLARGEEKLAPEVNTVYDVPPTYAENI
jgi:hypothetical protein